MNNVKKSYITGSVNLYRECVRSIWNSYLINQYQSTQNHYLLDSFGKIKDELFNSIVLAPLFLDEALPNFKLGFPNPQIKIIPARNNEWDLPVEINRNKGDTCGYWDHPITRINSHAELLFVNFFDWDSYGFLDMSRILVKISDYPENLNLIGHYLIVESIYTDIIFRKFGGQV